MNNKLDPDFVYRRWLADNSLSHSDRNRDLFSSFQQNLASVGSASASAARAPKRSREASPELDFELSQVVPDSKEREVKMSDEDEKKSGVQSFKMSGYDYKGAIKPEDLIPPRPRVTKQAYRRLWNQANPEMKKYALEPLTGRLVPRSGGGGRYKKRSYSRFRGRRRSYRGGRRIRGRGDYISDAWNKFKSWVPRGSWSSLGTSLGRATGIPGLASAGGYAGDRFSRLVGFGDYASTGMQPVDMGREVPSFGDMSQGVLIQHREFVQDLCEVANANSIFTNRSFAIQPANSITFPWLSQIASQFDQYQFLGCVFQYVSNSSDVNNASGGGLGLGSVIMATDYDVIDAAYTSKVQMENAQYTCSNKASVSFQHPIECSRDVTSVPVMYIRTGAVPTGRDPRLYDLGNFQIATVGIPSNTNAQTLGELWVTYSVLLLKPQLTGGQIGDDDIFMHWSLPISTVSASSTAYFGNPVPTAPQTGSNGPNITLSTTGVITFPPDTIGNWMLLYTVTGASTTLTTAMANSFGANVLQLEYFDVNTTNFSRQTAGAIATRQIAVLSFYFAGANVTGNTVSFTAGTLPGTISGADLFIWQTNNNVVS